MIDRRRRVSGLWSVSSVDPMRPRARARKPTDTTTMIDKLLNRHDSSDEQHTETDTSEPERIDGTVLDVRDRSDPRLPESATDEEIELLSDGADLLRLRTGIVEIETLTDRLRDTTTAIQQIDEVLVDLDGIDIEPGDEILVEGYLIEEHDDPDRADLWLVDESPVARTTGRDRQRISSLEIRDDQLDETMRIRPHCSRGQWARILYQRANSRLGALMEGAA